MSEYLEKTVLAIDAGGTYFKSALVNSRGEILNGSFFQAAVFSQGPKEQITGAYEEILKHALSRQNTKITGIGISTPGPFDYEKGMSLMTHKFQSIKGVPLRDEIHSLGILPEKVPIVFMQDVHAFLAGEHWTGAVKGVDNIAAITLGTGLGFGIMKKGKILDNGKGGPCVSIFNRPYKKGILEDVVSRRGIIARYQKDVDVCEIAEKARAGDANAIRVFQETGEILAGELTDILVEHGIGSVVFGGQISKSFDLFGPAFQGKLNTSGMEVKAFPGKNIDLSSLTGASSSLFG